MTKKMAVVVVVRELLYFGMKKALLFALTVLFILTLSQAGSSQSLKQPSFPGGNQAFNKYIFGNIAWPKVNGVFKAGSLIVTFYVEKDGTLDGFDIEKSFSPEVDAAVLKLLKVSPKWNPAMQGDMPTRSHYRLPVTYHVDWDQTGYKDSVLKD